MNKTILFTMTYQLFTIISTNKVTNDDYKSLKFIKTKLLGIPVFNLFNSLSLVTIPPNIYIPQRAKI